MITYVSCNPSVLCCRLWRYKAATAPASGGRLKLKVAPREGAPDDGGAAQ